MAKFLMLPSSVTISNHTVSKETRKQDVSIPMPPELDSRPVTFKAHAISLDLVLCPKVSPT